MKKTRVLAFLAILAIVSFQTVLFAVERESESLVGVLSYIPAPDMSICFCGSFPLAVEGTGQVCYLLTEGIDLREFDGDRVLVLGKIFSGFCAGTIERPCSFVDVEKVVVLSRTGVTGIDWGALKMIYR
jgi:hypothetical protein